MKTTTNGTTEAVAAAWGYRDAVCWQEGMESPEEAEKPRLYLLLTADGRYANLKEGCAEYGAIDFEPELQREAGAVIRDSLAREQARIDVAQERVNRWTARLDRALAAKGGAR